MSTFVLVHGAWHGSWCWKRVRRTLQSQGHEVFAPTLTGVADRSHLAAPEIDLDTHIQDVVNLIRWEELSEIVLCGHSYGGMVVTGVADRMPERISALVYLDAFVPEDGENVAQHVPPEQWAMLLDGARTVGEGWQLPPIPAEIFNVNEADREWVNSQCTMQSIETFKQPIRLTGGISKIDSITYIRATGFEEGSPFPPFLEKARASGWSTHEVSCGHDVMVDEPEELSRLLQLVAG
ncbi:MAG: alpha/beta fold hydrolase [Gammaproteobacteria bacterium]|jgi:pimeloyl-ACP methyl ester carboxylesterase